jgi:hypothetical protein
MTHMDWVARQNKLELPNDEEEVNTRDIHKCDGQAHDPDTIAAPLRFRCPGLCSNKLRKHPGKSRCIFSSLFFCLFFLANYVLL